MGDVGGFLFGKKPKAEKSESGNKAYSLIRSTYGPAMGYTTQGGSAIANLLGVGGGGSGGGSGGGGGGKAGMNSSLPGGSSGGGSAGGQVAALDNWANSGGMSWLRDQGNKQITSNQAAKGLLNSGSTLTSLEKYGQGLGSTYLNQYMSHLFDFARLGLGAGGLVTQAGQYSKGTGAQPGKAGALPMLAGALI